MATQSSFFDQPIDPVIVGDSACTGYSIETRFNLFHKANPHVYRMIRQIALDLKLTGHKRMGMKAIFERLRWLYMVQTKGDVFKLNNNYTSHYARLIMAQEPELAGFFETREHAQAA